MVIIIFPLSVHITGEFVGIDPKGDDSLAQEIPSVLAVSLVQSMATLNPAFGSISGDPFLDESIRYVCMYLFIYQLSLHF